MSIHDRTHEAEALLAEATGNLERAVEWPLGSDTRDRRLRAAVGQAIDAGRILAGAIRDLDDKVDENDRRQDPHYDPGDE